MPHKNIWIRKDDEDLWDTLVDKPQWLHEALRGTIIPHGSKKVPDVVYVDPGHTKFVSAKGIADEFLDDKKFVRPANKYCSHGAAIGFCKKGCTK